MKTLVLLASVTFCCQSARAQVPSTAPAAGQPVPAASSAEVKGDPSRVAPRPDPAELKKKHGSAVAGLKRRQAEELKKLRTDQKSKTKGAAQKAAKAKKEEQRAELDALKAANRKELDQLQKERPGTEKKPEEVKKPEKADEKPAPAPAQKR